MEAFVFLATGLVLLVVGAYLLKVRVLRKLEEVEVELDCGLNLQQMVQEIELGWADNENIVEGNFPIKGVGKRKMVLVLIPSRNRKPEEILKEISKRGLHPGRIEHLLALGAQHPERLMQNAFVALGAVVIMDGHKRMPHLQWRILELGFFNFRLNESVTVLAYRKTQSLD